MESFQFIEMPVWQWTVLGLLILWEAIWKLIAMFRAGRRNQPLWFVCLAIFNTIGILPIIYLLTHKSK